MSSTETAYTPGPVSVRSAELVPIGEPSLVHVYLIVPVPPVTVACKCAVERQASTMLIATVGLARIVIVIESFAALHEPVGSFVVNVNVTEPELISA